jgi:serine/threonine-protein kinase
LVAAPHLDQGAGKLSHEDAVAGTPAYMSPEQICGKQLDARSDIYSVGCLAYFLLSGRPPFTGPPTGVIEAAHLHEPARPLTDCDPGVPAELQAIVLRCLAKDPAERFSSADSVACALDSCPGAGEWTVSRGGAVVGVAVRCARGWLWDSEKHLSRTGRPEAPLPTRS